MSLESEVKNRFSAWFTKKDSHRFKSVAEYYFQRAVFLSNDNIDPLFNSCCSSDKDNRLLARNIQKRLDIGIATELLIKSFYLQEGLMINLVKDKGKNMRNFPFSQEDDKELFSVDKTFTLNDLIEQLPKVKPFKKIQIIQDGFRVAKVFRNKEGHVVTMSHEYDHRDYDYIEKALKAFYNEAFNESLELQFSVEKNEEGYWKVDEKT